MTDNIPALPAEQINPNEPVVIFARFQCRDCGDGAPEWVRDTHDQDSAERIYSWENEHYERTNHTRFFLWKVERDHSEIMDMAAMRRRFRGQR